MIASRGRATGARWRVALKLGLALLVLAVVARKVSPRELGARLGRLDAGDVVLLASLAWLQTSLNVLRWWRLLRRLGERPRFAAIYGDLLVGLTFNLFLPTSVGGDVVRALRARERVSAPHHAWSSSIYERIAGLVALAAGGGVAAALGLGARASLPPEIRAVTMALGLAFVLAFFVASWPFRALAHLLERRLPAAALADVRGIVSDLEGPLATPAARAEAIAWSLLAQAVAILFVVAGARALGAPGHELAIVIGMPIVYVLSMAPLTLGGHGLREGLYVGVLGALGVPDDVALALAASFLASTLAFALAGLLVALAERAPRAAS